VRILLMRHCEAVAGADNDPERPLVPAALERLHRNAEGVHESLVEVTRLVSSPWRRARETAEALRLFLATDVRFETSEELLPLAAPAQALSLLERHAQESGATLLLIGHQPLLGRLIGLLCEGSHGVALAPAPGEVAVIDLDWPAAGLGSLRCWHRL